jgi:hypothetical protein
MTRLSLAGCVLLLALPVAARAELSCTETPHEAGQVFSGKMLRRRFTLVNRGTSVIEITEVKPGCGCLRPQLERPTLGPGERGALTLEINTLTQPAGPNSWHATVRYLENGRPGELTVQVRADLVPVVSVRPASILIHTHGAARGEFTLVERLARPLEVRALAAASDHVSFTAGAPVRDGECWKRTITMQVLPSMREGRHDDVLKVLTDDSQYAELSVPFTVVKRSPDHVQPSPSSLAVVAAKEAPPPSQIVMLSAEEDKPVVIDRVEAGCPFIRCTWASGPGSRSTLRVQFDRDKMPAERRFEAQLRVHIRQPTPQVLTIPVHGSSSAQ